MNKYEINSNAEFLSLGMANFVGSFFQSHPVGASLSRSAVNNGKSKIFNIITF